MARESKFKKLERQEGKPIGQILVEKLNQYEDVPTTAVNIGISYRHVLRKIEELGIVKAPPHWRLPEVEHAE